MGHKKHLSESRQWLTTPITDRFPTKGTTKDGNPAKSTAIQLPRRNLSSIQEKMLAKARAWAYMSEWEARRNASDFFFSVFVNYLLPKRVYASGGKSKESKESDIFRTTFFPSSFNRAMGKRAITLSFQKQNGVCAGLTITHLKTNQRGLFLPYSYN